MSSKANLDFLHSLARNGRAADRAIWMRIAADYFARAEPDDDHGEWIENLGVCLGDATPLEQSAYATKLAASRSRVPAMWEILAGQGGECARAAWKYAPRPPGPPEFEGRDPEAARAVATRADLDEAWIEALLSADDVEAWTALAANPRARLASGPLALLAERARARIDGAADHRLAQALLAREPVRLELSPLFLEATPPVRQALLLAAQRAELARRRPGATATLSRDTIARLEQAALEGDSEGFTLLLARSIGASHELATKIVADRQGEPLAVALAAIGAPNDVCVRILTATDMRAGDAYPRLRALARLSDILNPHAARRIIAALVDGGAGRPGGGVKTPSAHPRPAPAGTANRERPRLQPRKVSTVGAK